MPGDEQRLFIYFGFQKGSCSWHPYFCTWSFSIICERGLVQNPPVKMSLIYRKMCTRRQHTVKFIFTGKVFAVPILKRMKRWRLFVIQLYFLLNDHFKIDLTWVRTSPYAMDSRRTTFCKCKYINYRLKIHNSPTLPPLLTLPLILHPVRKETFQYTPYSLK